jgi:hypothetical protein
MAGFRHKHCAARDFHVAPHKFSGLVFSEEENVTAGLVVWGWVPAARRGSRWSHKMPQAEYFLAQADRYFRIARAKSDRKVAAKLEAMGREFLAKAERMRSDEGRPKTASKSLKG